MPIDVQKTTASLNIIPNDIMQKKTEAIVAFFHLLHDDKFEEEIVFSNLFDYRNIFSDYSLLNAVISIV